MPPPLWAAPEVMFLIVFPVIDAVPTPVAAIARVRPLVLVPAYAFVRLAIVLFVMLAEVELELRMPVRDSPGDVADVTALLTLRLFAVVVLPIVLPEMVFVPAVT